MIGSNFVYIFAPAKSKDIFFILKVRIIQTMKGDLKQVPHGAKSEIAKRIGISVVTVIRFFSGKKVSANTEVKILNELEKVLLEYNKQKQETTERIKELLQ